jgi:hypothetical protein
MPGRSGLIPESRAARAALLVSLGVIGGLAAEHKLPGSGNDYMSELTGRTDNYIAGQPFNSDDPKEPGRGFRLETLHHPNAAAVGAAFYNAAENAGAKDPAHPAPRIRAAVACATVALNGHRPSRDMITSWETAQRNNANPDNGRGEQADSQYTHAADICTAALVRAIAQHPNQDIAVPVATD